MPNEWPFRWPLPRLTCASPAISSPVSAWTAPDMAATVRSVSGLATGLSSFRSMGTLLEGRAVRVGSLIVAGEDLIPRQAHCALLYFARSRGVH